MFFTSFHPSVPHTVTFSFPSSVPAFWIKWKCDLNSLLLVNADSLHIHGANTFLTIFMLWVIKISNDTFNGNSRSEISQQV